MLELPPIPTGVVALGQPFTLKASQSIKLAGEPVRIRLEPWADDKRCPEDTTCTESAPVRIQISVWRDDHSTTYPVFTVYTERDGAVIEAGPESRPEVRAYCVKVTNVQPYPAAEQEIPYGNYQATLVATKDPEAAPDTDAGISVITDDPFVLAQGEQVALVGRTVVLQVEQVEHTPCPPEQGCTARISLHLGWIEDTVPTRQITLTATVDDTGAVLPDTGMLQSVQLVDGVGIRLLAVTEPTYEGAIPEDYRVRLVLEPGPRMPNGGVYAEPGEPFNLTPGYAATIGMDVLRVRFDSILEDSRCPANVLCVQAGKVMLGITISNSEQRATNYVLGGSTDEQGNLLGEPEIDHGGYTLRLSQVTPYPETTEPISTTAYQATFVAIAPANAIVQPTAAIEPPQANPSTGEALPLLCVNEFAAIRVSSGGAAEPVIQLTDPIRQDEAPGYGEAHALCNKPFGPEWVQAGPNAITEKANDLPVDTAFWIWDGMAGGLVRHPPAP
ncbi:MAG: hypothetical protein IPK16_19575 [Anaerolineales bacterium]|nr:hypothetical protein [Anaerolineales bacterium]